MDGFLTWLATSPNATWMKPALGAMIGAIASWAATSDMHPLFIAISAAVAPVLINWLNPAYVNYGRGVEGKGDIHDVFGTED